jgi:hypothetical protein
MENAKVVFTENLVNLGKYKKLNRRESGKLRFEKLLEAEKNGHLQVARNRGEVALLCGYSPEECACGKRGYSWVSCQVQRGKLSEVVLNEDGHFGMEYHVVSIPDYNNQGTYAQRERERLPQEVSAQNTVKMTLSKGQWRIEMEFANSAEACSFMKELMGGESDN